MNSLFLLLLLGLIVWFWQDSLRARETAISKSRAYCQNYQYQLLDQTVALSRIKPGRNHAGNFTWLRDYHFEFSLDGYERYTGIASLTGHQLTFIHLDHPQGRIIEHEK